MTAHTSPGAAETWRDPAAHPVERVRDLIARMSLREKIAQLYGVWVDVDATSGAVTPHQQNLARLPDGSELIRHGLGQLTRPYGTAPLDPAVGMRVLARSQREIIAAGRFGIPGAGARGVPHRPGRLASDRLPLAAVLGLDV